MILTDQPRIESDIQPLSTNADIQRLSTEEDIQRLARELQDATADEFAEMIRLLRSKPDDQVFGQAEFDVRDLAHKIAAKVVQAEANERQKGATKAPA